jgi:hypothetical protein
VARRVRRWLRPRSVRVMLVSPRSHTRVKLFAMQEAEPGRRSDHSARGQLLTEELRRQRNCVITRIVAVANRPFGVARGGHLGAQAATNDHPGDEELAQAPRSGRCRSRSTVHPGARPTAPASWRSPWSWTRRPRWLEPSAWWPVTTPPRPRATCCPHRGRRAPGPAAGARQAPPKAVDNFRPVQVAGIARPSRWRRRVNELYGHSAMVNVTAPAFIKQHRWLSPSRRRLMGARGVSCGFPP